MKFPLIRDIAITKVIYVDINTPIWSAIDKMIENNHRSVIVLDKESFRIFRVLDILHVQKLNMDLELPLKALSLPVLPVIYKGKNVLDTVKYLGNSLEHICVTNEDGTLYGLVTHTDITSNIDPDTLMDNYRLTDFLKLGARMKQSSKEIVTSKLLLEMFEGQFDNVIVVEDKKPIGILTTRDVMLLIKSKENLDLEISCYMSEPVYTVNQNASIKEALEFIKNMHYKRVVVVDDNGDLAGVIRQNELISLTYSKWAMLMKEYQAELSEINHILENKNREYEVLASTDSLTGLYNRYKFSELYLSAYTVMVQRHNKMSLILLDIDFFKTVNDTYGHNIGDKVLIQVAHAFLKTLRNIDIVCRWGGEEFLVLLPTANLENAYLLAQRVRKYIEELEIDIVGGITVSLGVSEIIEGETMEEGIARADKALYLAKQSGRNCVKTELDKRD